MDMHALEAALQNLIDTLHMMPESGSKPPTPSVAPIAHKPAVSDMLESGDESEPDMGDGDDAAMLIMKKKMGKRM